MNLENYDYMEEYLSKIQEERLAKQKNLALIKRQCIQKYVSLILDVFRVSTLESIDVNLDTLKIFQYAGSLKVSLKSTFEPNFYSLSEKNSYDSMLKNMPNTQKKMEEIENILPTKNAIYDIKAIFQSEPFSNYFLSEISTETLYITFSPKICKKN